MVDASLESSANGELQHEGLSLDELGELVNRQMCRLHNFIRRRVSNPADSEDLAQETILEALRSRRKFGGRSRPETWVFGIAVNQIRSYYKRRQRAEVSTEEIEDEAAGDPGPDPCELAQQHEFISRLDVAVSELSEDAVTMLQLVYDELLSYEEVAA